MNGRGAIEQRTFLSGEALAGALARRVAEALAARIERDGAALLSVSGGRTPALFLAALSAEPLAWEKVTVMLVDERWAPETSDRSNAKLVRAHLLQGRASAAQFLPLLTGAASPEEGLAEAEARLAGASWPLAAAVLGMGEDGHTASYFPHGEGLAAALAPPPGVRLAAIRAEAAGEPRITLTLPAILGAGLIALHIEGERKWRALEAALGEGPVEAMPIRAVLRAAARPVEVFWRP